MNKYSKIFEPAFQSEWINFITKKYSYPSETANILISCRDSILNTANAAALFNEILSEYTADYTVDFLPLLEKMNTVAEFSGENKFTVHLLFSILFLYPMQDIYIKKNLPSDMFDGVCLDFKYKLLECIDVYNVVGVFVMDWFDRYFNVTRFPMGRMQFEIVELSENLIINGVALKKGSPAINVHIPRSGERLDRNLVYSAYARAAEFYKDLFPKEYVVFVCETYLFHSSVLGAMKKGGNLYNFAADYTIKPFKDDENYFEMWRVFDCYIDENNLDGLPNNTSFRRNLIEYMKTGKPIGEGIGAFVYKR